MNFLEHVAKARVLAPAGIPIPRGRLCETPEAAAPGLRRGRSLRGQGAGADRQARQGRRHQAGPSTADEAREVTRRILGMTIDGHAVGAVLLEELAKIEREFYAAVLLDTAHRCPLVLFSTEGGMDIEEVAATRIPTLCASPRRSRPRLRPRRRPCPGHRPRPWRRGGAGLRGARRSSIGPAATTTPN